MIDDIPAEPQLPLKVPMRSFSVEVRSQKNHQCPFCSYESNPLSRTPLSTSLQNINLNPGFHILLCLTESLSGDPCRLPVHLEFLFSLLSCRWRNISPFSVPLLGEVPQQSRVRSPCMAVLHIICPSSSGFTHTLSDGWVKLKLYIQAKAESRRP